MKRIGPKTEPLGTPQVRSEGEDFFSIHSYYLCPVLLVGTEEGEGKITNTKSAVEASQLTQTHIWTRGNDYDMATMDMRR